MLAYIKTNSGSISIICDGKAYQIANDHANYNKIEEALSRKDVSALTRLVDMPKATVVFSKGLLQVEDQKILYNGKELHNSLVSRILEMIKSGLDFKPMARFLENLMQNPSSRAVNELYEFLMHKNLPITDDGCFLAYKAVRHNWLDFHSATYDNSIGKVVRMERNEVDDDRAHECSQGLHVGAMEYVSNFHSNEPRHITINKVNPKDVVSVPRDHNATKVRVCEYEVMCEYTGELTKPVYTSTVGDYVPEVEDDVDDCEDLFEDDPFEEYPQLVEDETTIDQNRKDQLRVKSPSTIPTPPQVWEFTPSSQVISSIKYNEAGEMLTIVFKGNNNCYTYQAVPKEVAEGFRNASSVGEYFAENIKGLYLSHRA